MASASPATVANQRPAFRSVPLLTAPGTAWSYSLAVDMLGAMLDAACARPLEAIARVVVTQPLDLDSIAFVGIPERVLATPYVSTAAFPERMSTRDNGPGRDLLCARPCVASRRLSTG